MNNGHYRPSYYLDFISDDTVHLHVALSALKITQGCCISLW